MISEKAEELYSYLTGLAPVGEPIELPVADLMADMGWNTSKASYYSYLNELISRKFVRRIAQGNQQTTGALEVIKHYEVWKVALERKRALARLERKLNSEQMQITSQVTVGMPRDRVKKSDWLERIKDIPEDTRDLTGQLLGDPLPARSALWKRQCAQSS